MAPPADLREIGLDGFALTDKIFGPTRRTIAWQGRRVVQVNNDHEREEPVINSKEAAAYYGGIMIVNYPKAKPQYRWGRPIKP